MTAESGKLERMQEQVLIGAAGRQDGLVARGQEGKTYRAGSGSVVLCFRVRVICQRFCSLSKQQVVGCRRIVL